MYTLKMRSAGFPAERPEHREEIRREVERLASRGYVVRVVDDPPIAAPGGNLFRQELEVSRGLRDLVEIRTFGAEIFFGTPCPNHISVVFHDALWFSPRWIREVGESDWENNPDRPWQTTTYHEHGNGSRSFHWRLEADSAARTVEVSGVGLVNPDELYMFYDVLSQVERRLRIGRKLGQLVGLAKADNWGGLSGSAARFSTKPSQSRKIARHGKGSIPPVAFSFWAINGCRD